MHHWFLLGVMLGCVACTKEQPPKHTPKAVTAVQMPQTKLLYQAKDWAHIKAGRLTYPVGIKGAPTEVSISRDFSMKVTEVTQTEWHALMGSRPSQFKGCPRCPVERVSWFDAIKYANRLSAAEKKPQCYSDQGVSAYTPIYDCPGYRLPTEAEWMLAASRHGHSKVDGASSVVSENSGQKTHEVGTKQPSTDGVFDLYGNVWEWCHDYYAEWSAGRSLDPLGPLTGKMRVARGGSWSSPSKDLTPFRPRFSHLPANKTPTRGFRLVRTQIKTKTAL
jgi:formylglycine-generating enzyme required for sulfatase activity